MESFLFVKPFLPAFDIKDETTTGNESDPLDPEVWVMEGLLQLEANKVAAGLVNQDVSAEVARFGQIIHTHRPADMVASRKRDGQAVKTSKARVTGVDIKLNQWIHQSFVIYDGEESVAMKSLIDVHLVPAMRSISQMIDEIVLTQVYQFIGKTYAGSLDEQVSKATIIDARRKLIKQFADPMNMAFLVSPDAEADILNIDALTEVDAAGDAGAALRNAIVGKMFGFIFFMDQNVPSVSTMADTRSALVNNAAGYPKGHTGAINVDTIAPAGTIAVGSWVKFGNSPYPQQVTASTATSITIGAGLVKKLSDDETIAIYPSEELSANFAIDYIDDLKANAPFTEDIQKGQLVSFGAKPEVYGVVTTPEVATVNGTEEAYDPKSHLTLDLPLAQALVNTDRVSLGPDGNYNFAFHKNAMTLVTRPPAPPRANTGVMSFIAAHNDNVLRATISYDALQQGHRVTIDVFAGIKVIDERLGCAVYSKAAE